MENVCTNISPLSDRKSPTKRKPRFSLVTSPKRSPRGRRSINQSLILSDSMGDTGSSSDADWAIMKSKMDANKQRAKAIMDDSDDYYSDASFDEDDIDPVVRAITFESPDRRMSINTINNKNEELNLYERDVELDEELNYLQEAREIMVETFIAMMTELTQQRIYTEKKIPAHSGRDVDAMNAVNTIDFENIPFTEWASAIDSKVDSVIV